jgi:hypothetical protein
MEYLYLPKSGDREIISDEIAKYERFSNNQLEKAIEGEMQVGVVGSRRQMLILIALRIVARRRKIDCLIEIKDNCLIYFRDK